MMNKIPLFDSWLIALLFFPWLLSAQGPDRYWFEKNDEGNRYEGSYSRKVANPAVELLSFTAGPIEPFEAGKGQQLNVRFCMPTAGPYWLKAEELRPVQFYWMEGKETIGKKGWNQFDNWPVDQWLRRLKIPSRNLGLIVKLGDPKSPLLIPAQVYHSGPRKAIERYLAHFRLGQSISKATINLYRGRHESRPPSDRQIHALSISRKAGGSYFPYAIPAGLLDPSPGWYTLIMELQKQGSTHRIPFSFVFYHQPG